MSREVLDSVKKIFLFVMIFGISGVLAFVINLTIPPGLGTGDVSLLATAGGAQTPSGVVLPLQ